MHDSAQRKLFPDALIRAARTFEGCDGENPAFRTAPQKCLSDDEILSELTWAAQSLKSGESKTLSPAAAGALRRAMPINDIELQFEATASDLGDSPSERHCGASWTELNLRFTSIVPPDVLAQCFEAYVLSDYAFYQRGAELSLLDSNFRDEKLYGYELTWFTNTDSLCAGIPVDAEDVLRTLKKPTPDYVSDATEAARRLRDESIRLWQELLRSDAPEKPERRHVLEGLMSEAPYAAVMPANAFAAIRELVLSRTGTSRWAPACSSFCELASASLLLRVPLSEDEVRTFIESGAFGRDFSAAVSIEQIEKTGEDVIDGTTLYAYELTVESRHRSPLIRADIAKTLFVFDDDKGVSVMHTFEAKKAEKRCETSEEPDPEVSPDLLVESKNSLFAVTASGRHFAAALSRAYGGLSEERFAFAKADDIIVGAVKAAKEDDRKTADSAFCRICSANTVRFNVPLNALVTPMKEENGITTSVKVKRFLRIKESELDRLAKIGIVGFDRDAMRTLLNALADEALERDNPCFIVTVVVRSEDRLIPVSMTWFMDEIGFTFDVLKTTEAA